LKASVMPRIAAYDSWVGVSAVPAAVALSVVVEGRTVLLRWTRPTRNADGSPLTDLNHFLLLRAAEPLPGGPADPGPRPRSG